MCAKVKIALEFVRVISSGQNITTGVSFLFTVIALDYDVRELKRECSMYLTNLCYRTANDDTSEKS